MISQIDQHATDLNRTKNFYFYTILCIGMVRAVILCLVTTALWNLLVPGQQSAPLLLGALVLGLGLVSLRWRRPQPISASALAMALEIDHPDVASSAFELKKLNHTSQVWGQKLRNQRLEVINFERLRTARQLSTLVLPLLVFAGLGFQAPQGLSDTFAGVRRAVARLEWGASLVIIEGKAKEEAPNRVKLNASSLQRVDLIDQNMIEIEVVGSSDRASEQVVELRKRGGTQGELLQSFQMMAVRDTTKRDGEFNATYKVSFSVSETVDLHLPAFSDNALAEIVVKQLPVPMVQLETEVKNDPDEPWPDDRPLPLRIKVDAENPIQLVRLVITAGKRSSTELVNNVLAQNLRKIETDYELLLEPYIDTDLSQVEIYAEAVDRSVPNPLVGRSPSLQLTTASAYGRYRQTLSTLKELKFTIDQAVDNGDSKLPAEAEEISARALKKSEDSPFFDSFDRVGITNLKHETDYLVNNPDRLRLIDMSEQLNDFLLEHEMLDARERDRDFFVAIRGLARLLEQDRGKRPVGVEAVAQRIKSFLQERRKFWEIRTGRLDEKHLPSRWNEIKRNQPFIAAINKTAASDAKNTPAGDSAAVKILSDVATSYRSWIEELEASEDAARAEAESQRQQGLASARDTLRELQKRQDDISQKLDRADAQKPEQLQEQWPSLRSKQNANIKGTKSLEAQMRALSPSSAERIKLAIEVMGVAVEAGNNNKFAGEGGAEQASDLAARALRQAQNAAQKSQRKSGSQRGRRRRVQGNNYYGQGVVGGDVEISREYQVDKRYREDILDEVRQTLNDTSERSEKEDRKILESYLRQVIR